MDTYNYILIDNGATNRCTLLDRNRKEVIEIINLPYYKQIEVKNITKEIFKYHRKHELRVGEKIFDAFISGQYDSYDLLIKSNSELDINYYLQVKGINFNLDTYYMMCTEETRTSTKYLNGVFDTDMKTFTIKLKDGNNKTYYN